MQWARQDSNLRPNGYASHYSFHCPGWVCGLDCPFAPEGRLPSSLYTFLSREAWLGITLSSDLRPEGLGFPEFDRIHQGIAPQAAHCSFMTA